MPIFILYSIMYIMYTQPASSPLPLCYITPYRIVQKKKSTNKHLNVKSQVVLILLLRNYIFFHIYKKVA